MRPIRLGSAALLLAALGGALQGCQNSQTRDKAIVDNGPMYVGPRVFHGTVGSLARFGNDEPMLVSGYGLVIGLRGTGSTEVPPYLNAYMQDQIKRGGGGTMDLASVFSGQNAAVVAVQGLVQPGAFAGDRFDLFVESTVSGVSSLAGGRLYTTDLQPGAPARDPGKYLGRAGTAGGAVYTDPFDKQGWEKARTTNLTYEEFQRQGIVLGGGVVAQDRPVYLTLNQPSFIVANQIVEAINARFPPTQVDRAPAAAAQDSQRITLRVPQAFRNDPGAFIEQVRWLYMQRVDPSFAVKWPPQMILALTEVEDAKQPEFARHCVQAWQALGKGVLPVLHQAYALEAGSQAERDLLPELLAAAAKDAKDPAKGAQALAKARAAYPLVRDAAVQAGAALGDSGAIALLAATAHSAKDPAVRIRCIGVLADQPNHKVALGTIRDLIADEDTAVRVAAYDAYARCFARLSDMVGPAEAEKWMGDFHRTFAYGSDQQPKYAVDVVPLGKPLVVMSVSGRPRVAVLGADAGLTKPLSLWFDDNAARRTVTDGPGREAAVKQLAADAKITEAEARARLESFDKAVADSAIPLGGPGRLNLRVADEPVTEEMRTFQARQIKAEKGISFAEAYKLIPASREVLAFAFQPPSGARLEFKAVNSLATLLFALGHHEGAGYAQKGLSFGFDRVTRVVRELSVRGALTAPLEIRMSPLADRMRKAAENARKPDAQRPEGGVEDLSGALGAAAKPAETPKADAKDKPKDAGADGPNPFRQN